MALLDQTSTDAACAEALGIKNVLELHGLSIALSTVIIAAP
jgi:hypothetical protein